MSTIAVSMVKDEADIIATTVRHMIGQVDHVIVADNLSTDGTSDILDSLPITVIDDPVIAYDQSAKMTRLAGIAHDMGAEWIVPFDADEIWYSPQGRIADVLAELPDDVKVAIAALWDHVPTGQDPDADCPVQSMGWRNTERSQLHKVACRWTFDMQIQMGNHNVRYTATPGWPHVCDGYLEIRHFPYRTPQQFVSKARNGAAAYAASDMGEEHGGHWRAYGRILERSGEQTLIDDVFRRWFYRDDPYATVVVAGVTLPELVYDPAPINR